MKSDENFLEVTRAEYLSGHKLRLMFNDGFERVLDFEPFLAKAHNPDTSAYRDVKLFKTFRVEDGDLVWGDFQMIFPIVDLYRGNLFPDDPLAQIKPKVSVIGSAVGFKKAKAVSRKNTLVLAPKKVVVVRKKSLIPA